jgi:heterogeneous nuclear ribonucleoprotein L
MMLYGIDQENYNCDKVFNLLCNYGNCMKVKFLMTKKDTCMVQMGNPKEVHNAIKFLQDAPVFGNTLTLRPSKQDELQERAGPFELPDGTPSFKDFSSSRQQRFSTPEQASRNRLVYPTAQLHWYNAPTSMTEERLKKLFDEKNAPVPEKVIIFNTKSDRSTSGLADFGEMGKEKALQALMLVNHTPVQEHSGKPPYIVKLAFNSK